MKWYRLENNEIEGVQILRHTNTYVVYICRFTGLETKQCKHSKNINWFYSLQMAKEFQKAQLNEQINKVVNDIFTLNEKLSNLKSILKEI